MNKGFLPLTARQRACFWEAHKAACIEMELSTRDEREAYRKRVMREECGKEHVSELGRTADFDKVMARFARDAGDWQAAAKFAAADEARQAALVRICCAQILQLKGCGEACTEAGAEYLAGVVEQARIPCGRDVRDSSFWLDCNPRSLVTLFRILDTHRRRLIKRLCPAAALAFDAHTVYTVLPDGLRSSFVPGVYDGRDSSIRVNVR